MKKYYVDYWSDFCNTYNLYYVDESMDMEIPHNWEHITRAEAIHLARMERESRRRNPNFAHYADDSILPADWARDSDDDIRNDPRYYLDGCIWERRRCSAE